MQVGLCCKGRPLHVLVQLLAHSETPCLVGLLAGCTFSGAMFQRDIFGSLGHTKALAPPRGA